MSATPAHLPLVVEERLGPAIRTVLALAGAMALILPAVELWRGIWPLNGATPFFAIIVLGAAQIGAVFLAAGILGPVKRWTVLHGIVRIEFLSWAFHRTTTLHRHDVREVRVDKNEDTDGPQRFVVSVRDLRDRYWRSPPYPTRDAAEALRAETIARLDLS